MSGAPVVPSEGLCSFCVSVFLNAEVRSFFGGALSRRSVCWRSRCLWPVPLLSPTILLSLGTNTDLLLGVTGTHKTQEDPHVFLGTDECLRWNSFWFKSLSNVAVWRTSDPAVFCVNLNFPVENTHCLSTWPAPKLPWCHSFGFYPTSFYPEWRGMNGSHTTTWDSVS